MPEERIRPRNVAMLFKLETTSGTDAAPDATDGFPFEADGYSYNTPYTREQSNEATGSLVSAAPLIIGQPAEVTIRVRIKGAGAGVTYTSLIKPPHHALLAACGLRGLFTAGVSAAALTAGTTNSATLGTGFASTAQAYRGMPLQLAAGPSNGRLVHVADYNASKLANLTDLFGSPLTSTVTAALPPNWSYAGTSPKDAAARATDHPSGTLYLYEDGTLHKFVGMRGAITQLGGQVARPGYASFRFVGIYLGKTDAAVPTVTVPQHAAPTLNMGTGGINEVLLLNRKGLAVSQWNFGPDAQLENPTDPNTPYGFGTGEIGGRTPVLTLDPLATLKANRDVIADIEASAQYQAVIRHGATAGNRWSIVFPQLWPAEAAPGMRGIFRSEQLTLQATNPGVDASTRDAEAVLCFY